MISDRFAKYLQLNELGVLLGHCIHYWVKCLLFWLRVFQFTEWVPEYRSLTVSVTLGQLDRDMWELMNEESRRGWYCLGGGPGEPFTYTGWEDFSTQWNPFSSNSTTKEVRKSYRPTLSLKFTSFYFYGIKNCILKVCTQIMDDMFTLNNGSH